MAILDMCHTWPVIAAASLDRHVDREDGLLSAAPTCHATMSIGRNRCSLPCGSAAVVLLLACSGGREHISTDITHALGCG